jgi:hypothetical protein
MELQELLKPANLDLNKTLVLRHVPMEPNIRRILPWLVAERPALFNAYQQIQNPKVENQMRKAEHVVSFFGHESSRAVYLGTSFAGYGVQGYHWSRKQLERSIAHTRIWSKRQLTPAKRPKLFLR